MKYPFYTGKFSMSEDIAYFAHEMTSRFSDVWIEKKTDESFFVKHKSDPSKVIEVWVDKEEPRRCSAKYKELKIKRNGDRYLQTSECSRMTIEGLLWVTEQVFQYGYVKPEFE